MVNHSIRAVSQERVKCSCPDGRSGGIERVRAVATLAADGQWICWAVTHGPGTSCGLRGNGSYWQETRVSSKDEAVEWLERVTQVIDRGTQ